MPIPFVLLVLISAAPKPLVYITIAEQWLMQTHPCGTPVAGM